MAQNNNNKKASGGSGVDLWKYVLFFLSVYVLPLEMLIHKRFGERYFRLRAFLSFLVLAYVFGVRPGTGLDAEGYDPLFILRGFVVVVFARMMTHYLNIRFRNKHDHHWHSRSPGISILVSPKAGLDEVTIQMYIEPLICFIVGGLVFGLTYVDFSLPDNLTVHMNESFMILGFYISSAAVLIFIRNQMMAWIEKEERLDMQDQLIESKYREQFFLNDAPQTETDGFIVMGSKPATKRKRQELADMYDQIDPKLQGIIYGENQNI